MFDWFCARADLNPALLTQGQTQASFLEATFRDPDIASQDKEDQRGLPNKRRLGSAASFFEGPFSRWFLKNRHTHL